MTIWQAKQTKNKTKKNITGIFEFINYRYSNKINKSFRRRTKKVKWIPTYTDEGAFST
jgi:hypothetical protein